MAICRAKGFAPVGSGWGVRFKLLDWIAEEIGFRCYDSDGVVCQLLCLLACRKTRN